MTHNVKEPRRMRDHGQSLSIFDALAVQENYFAYSDAARVVAQGDTREEVEEELAKQEIDPESCVILPSMENYPKECQPDINFKDNNVVAPPPLPPQQG